MRNFSKCLLVVAMMVSSISHSNESNFNNEQSPTIATEENKITHGNYVGGGLIGTVVGFGLGHVVQTRPDKGKQLFFTISEGSVIVGSIVGVIGANMRECTGGGQREKECRDSRSDSTASVLAVGAVAFVSLRLWEIYDLWSYPHQPAPEKTLKGAVFIHPRATDQVATSFVLNF